MKKPKRKTVGSRWNFELAEKRNIKREDKDKMGRFKGNTVRKVIPLTVGENNVIPLTVDSGNVIPLTVDDGNTIPLNNSYDS